MSDLTITAGVTDSHMLLLGRIDGKLDGLIATMNRMENDHRNLQTHVATENTAIKAAMVAESSALRHTITALDDKFMVLNDATGARLDRLKDHLEGRIDLNYSKLQAMATERATIAKFGSGVLVVIGAAWAFIQWAAPLLMS